ncbi:MAG: nuclease [Betaproteobacteria bacterium HGW-Betaproteobacteria-15]|nr:MAG: nuclease [Betaproteobacteria bacterium HGW-Betaproteobacteria-15]
MHSDSRHQESTSLKGATTHLYARRCPGTFFEGQRVTGRHSHWRFILLLIACWSISSLLQAQSIQGLVVSIADGDTLTVLDAQKVQHKIRLAGIDTPERRQPFGQRAREALSTLVFQKVVLVLTEKKDRYGRWVGKVISDGRDVNLVLVVDGWAWHYKKYAGEQSSSDRLLYASAEEDARSQRSGLWSDPYAIPPWDWRAGAR